MSKPIFPEQDNSRNSRDGMTLREYYAGQALIGLIMNRPTENVHCIADLAIEIAEALEAKTMYENKPLSGFYRASK